MPALNPIYCRKCKKEISPDNTYCPKCGAVQDRLAADVNAATEPPPPIVHATPIPTPSSPPTSEPPHAVGPQVIQVTNVQTGSNAGWWAAAFLLLFGTPLGCITIPLAIIVLLAAISYGIYVLPLAIAFCIVAALAMTPRISANARTVAIICVAIVGILAQALYMASMK